MLKKQNFPFMLSKWESFDSFQNFYSRYGYVVFFSFLRSGKYAMLLNTTLFSFCLLIIRVRMDSCFDMEVYF